ncbi:hypothetical protein DFH11DRAFT_116561 [Phellopilus nigrolimitatus]|nr:hypothetical protein DFH11DRAFT_116561 [Phellopilus nigrolimitatus]
MLRHAWVALSAIMSTFLRRCSFFARSSPRSNGTNMRAPSAPLTRAPLLHASRRRRTPPWRTPVTRPPPGLRARIFSTNKWTTLSACLAFPCRTPSSSLRSLLTGPGAYPASSASSTSLLFSRALLAPHAAGASSALYPAPGHGHALNRARPSTCFRSRRRHPLRGPRCLRRALCSRNTAT